MKKIYLFAITFLIASVTFGQNTISGSFQYGGVQRDYLLYVPAIYNTAEVSVPLVFNLHGLGSNNTQQNLYGDLKPYADTDNFIICIPNGTFNISGQRFWNAGFGMGVDDVGFINALIDTIMAQYDIDSTRIFSTGMSNGGFMSLTLACELSNRISKVASVTGTMVAGQALSCAPERGIPVMLIHGTEDNVVPYGGGGSTIPGILSVDSVINLWVRKNECLTPAQFTPIPDNNPNDGSIVERYDYVLGIDNSTVVLFKVIGGGHTWPGSAVQIPGTNMDINASFEIWKFFKTETYTSTTRQLSDKEVTIYPNPAAEWVKIDAENMGKLVLYSASGQKIIEKEIENTETLLNVANLPSGLYFISLHDGNTIVTKKLIKN
jgi:polyhydroxybutyrate depolymerase